MNMENTEYKTSLPPGLYCAGDMDLDRPATANRPAFVAAYKAARPGVHLPPFARIMEDGSIRLWDYHWRGEKETVLPNGSI